MLRILVSLAGVALALPLVLAVSSSVTQNAGGSVPENRGFGTAFSGAIRVIDADTLDVGTERVRLFGIDAPEVDQTCMTRGADWACGSWATSEAKSLLSGRHADCETMDRDRYGRTVARCRIGGTDVAGMLVDRGIAYAYRRYSMDYASREIAASKAAIGIHGAEDVMTPASFRETQRTDQDANATTLMTANCAIKGNVSGSSGEKIYHVPGQRHYDDTRINTAKGERVFCSEDEARAAGWRKARS